MRVVYTVLCLLVVIAGVFCARSKKECNEGWYTKIATINSGESPYWYQMSFKHCIQGSTIPELPVRVINVESPSSSSSLLEISDFPLLKQIYLDNNEIQNLPEFINLPKVEKISLASNKLKNIPSNVVSEIPVKELILSRNTINSIGKGAFGNEVEIIFMTCNKISSLSPTWFKNPAKVRVLKFGGNQITSVPDNMFKDFVNLEELELRNNLIKTLGIGSISGPRHMRFLHLAYNNISEIKAEVFGPQINISNFNVEYNRLSFLHQAMMDKMSAKSIQLWGNPWQCPCQKSINDWVTKNNKDLSQGLPRDEDPSCVIALSFKDKCVPFVDDDLYHTFLMTFEVSPFQFC